MRDTEKLGSGGLNSQMEKPQHPGAQCIYYMQLSLEAGLSHTAEQGGSIITYT